MREAPICIFLQHSLTRSRNMRGKTQENQNSINLEARSGQKPREKCVEPCVRSHRIWWNYMPSGKNRMAICMDRIRYGRESLKNCSRLKRPKIRCLPLMQPSGIWRVIRLWTGWSAGMSVTERRRLRSVQLSKQCRRINRWHTLRRQPFLPSRFIIRFPREWRISLSGWICCAVSARQRSRRRPSVIWKKDRWILLWEHTGFCQKMCSLKILGFLSWTRNNGLVWLTKKKSNS